MGQDWRTWVAVCGPVPHGHSSVWEIFNLKRSLLLLSDDDQLQRAEDSVVVKRSFGKKEKGGGWWCTGERGGGGAGFGFRVGCVAWPRRSPGWSRTLPLEAGCPTQQWCVGRRTSSCTGSDGGGDHTRCGSSWYLSGVGQMVRADTLS